MRYDMYIYVIRRLKVKVLLHIRFLLLSLGLLILFCPYNLPHAKLSHKNDLNEYYFYDAAITKKKQTNKLSGESSEAFLYVK